ncbi:DUF1760-domain-containing protein [Poronia punctata]|nr:DUF1760-domain-containing protein [Poronia punctata]
MPELSESIAAIREGAKEEPFTYLTILEYHIQTPGVLPVLNEVLQNADLTREIGWDLVQMLLTVDGSENCLETVARLGNPREVSIKVMEALDKLAEAWGEDVEDVEDAKSETPDDTSERSKVASRFITLTGMLAIIQERIKTKHPSRFLGPSLAKVFVAYHPTPEITTAVINLVRSLSGRRRPPLPSRSSSINIANPDKDGDLFKNAPDPEAEQEDPIEESLNQKLLQSFTTAILQRYVNANEMQWAPRLLEVYYPEKVVPGKLTTAQSFREDEVLQQRDAVVGQLVALLRDLGLDDTSSTFVKSILTKPTSTDPLEAFEKFESVEDIHLSPGGVTCLVAYWILSTDLFGADNPVPEMHLFPDHLHMLEQYLGTDPQGEINTSPGTADALVAIGLGLLQRGLIRGVEEPSYMAYHHRLTLIAVFHPNLDVRNAATNIAGTLLHSDPDEENRLDILEDLLENCQFSTLKACAIKWLQEEIISAQKNNVSNLFSNPEVIERLRYAIFPDMRQVSDMEEAEFFDFWAENQQFLLQTVNFGYFLLKGHSNLVPDAMAAAMEERFSEPLLTAARKFEQTEGLDAHEKLRLGVLSERLQSYQTPVRADG